MTFEPLFIPPWRGVQDNEAWLAFAKIVRTRVQHVATMQAEERRQDKKARREAWRQQQAARRQ